MGGEGSSDDSLGPLKPYRVPRGERGLRDSSEEDDSGETRGRRRHGRGGRSDEEESSSSSSGDEASSAFRPAENPFPFRPTPPSGGRHQGGGSIGIGEVTGEGYAADSTEVEGMGRLFGKLSTGPGADGDEGGEVAPGGAPRAAGRGEYGRRRGGGGVLAGRRRSDRAPSAARVGDMDLSRPPPEAWTAAPAEVAAPAAAAKEEAGPPPPAPGAAFVFGRPKSKLADTAPPSPKA